jgi:hypothetical protein
MAMIIVTAMIVKAKIIIMAKTKFLGFSITYKITLGRHVTVLYALQANDVVQMQANRAEDRENKGLHMSGSAQIWNWSAPNPIRANPIKK